MSKGKKGVWDENMGKCIIEEKEEGKKWKGNKWSHERENKINQRVKREGMKREKWNL